MHCTCDRVWKTHEIELDREANSIRVPLETGTTLVFLNTDIVNGFGLYACDLAPVLRGDTKSAYHYQTPQDPYTHPNKIGKTNGGHYHSKMPNLLTA